MSTKYKKVAVSERNDEKSEVFFTIEADGQKSTRLFNGNKKRFFGRTKPEYYLLEVPDYEDEMRDLLQQVLSESDSYGYIEPETLTKIENLLNKLKQQS